MKCIEAHDIDELNHVISVTVDSMLDYAAAAKKAHRFEYKVLFERCVLERERVVSRLQQEVRRLGGTPVDDGTFSASMRRIFFDLNAALGRGDRAIVRELERDEDVVTSKYQAILQEGHISRPAFRVVQECSEVIRSAHDRISEMKHSM